MLRVLFIVGLALLPTSPILIRQTTYDEFPAISKASFAVLEDPGLTRTIQFDNQQTADPEFLVEQGIADAPTKQAQHNADVAAATAAAITAAVLEARTAAVNALWGPGSPLAPDIPEMLQAAADNGIDWRLLPVIAVLESGDGRALKAVNIFGFGYMHFATNSDAIETVAQALARPPYAGYSLAATFSMYRTGSPGALADPTDEAARQSYVGTATWLANQLTRLGGP